MFNKSPKLNFYCSLPEVMDRYPIIPAKNFRPQWARDSAVAYKEFVKNSPVNVRTTGTVKCPGIRDISSKGFILQSWFDFSILTTDNPIEFQYALPQGLDKHLKDLGFKKDLIEWFSGDVPQVTIPLANNNLQTLLKIITPWAVSIPKGWSLLIMPIPYPDEPEFTATHGILGQGDFYEINPILKWHKRPGELLVKAGTPLCQLIPIKDNTIEYEITEYTNEIKQKERNWLFNMTHSFSR
jgi:hypothetical protein